MLFFAANDGSHGTESWRMSYGTQAGTTLSHRYCARLDSSNPAHLVNINGTLFFTADDGSHGTELWMSDGTQAGTRLVADIAPGLASSNPVNLVNLSGTLFFSSGIGLWKSNGTEIGTTLVKDIFPGMVGPVSVFALSFHFDEWRAVLFSRGSRLHRILVP